MGTIRAVHETSIGSKLLARVVEVNLKAGQEVRRGDVLVRLDDSDIRARLQQAQAALDEAHAAHQQAVSEEKRAATMLQARAASKQAYEQAVMVLRSAEAGVRRAEEAVNEAQATLDWATVVAPMDARVIDKKVEVGDTVTPGQVLVTLFDPKRMQLVAHVRESLAQRLEVGQPIGVQVEGLGKQCEGTVSEKVPQVSSASRTFEVKVTGPCPTGIYSGMFGRILIPLEEEEILLVPQSAVRLVGQLELVDVVEEEGPVRRAIRTGRVLGDEVEVLSGLRQGEKVVVPPAAQGDAHHG